jgi:hypothetical protein
MADDQKDLTEWLRGFTKGMPADTLAKYIHPKLLEAAEESSRAAKRLKATEAEISLGNFYAEVILLAAKALQKCEQEQWRQREAIKLFLYGQLDRHRLRDISSTWNYSPVQESADAKKKDS